MPRVKHSGQTAREPTSQLRAPVRNRRRQFWLLGTLGLIFCVAWVAGAPARLVNHFADRNLRELQNDRAQQWLAWSQWLQPENPQFLLLSARLSRREGDFASMQRLLKRSAHAGAKQKQIELEQTLALAQAGNLAESESEINRLILQRPDELAEISAAYCNGLAATGRIEESLVVIDAWEGDIPEDPRPSFRRGMLLEHRQDFNRAVDEYRSSVAKNAQFYAGWYSLGRVLKVQKQIASALEAFRQCLLMKEPLAAQIGIAGCLREQGEIEQARELLKKVMAAEPAAVQRSFSDVAFLPEGNIAARELGALEAVEGDYEKARPLLEKALQDWPGDIEARYSYATTLRGLGESANAAAEFERVRVAREALAVTPVLVDKLKKDPNNSEIRMQLGEIHWKYESARKGAYWINSILAYDPENNNARILLERMQAQPVPSSVATTPLSPNHTDVSPTGRQTSSEP